MPNSYISKVRIGNTDFSFRDAEALAAAQSAVDGVTDDVTFKDANGKMYKLALDGKKVKLVAVSYTAPTASITAATWNGITATISSGNASLSRYVDQDGTDSVTGNITGSITTANASKPTVTGASGPTVENSASPWTMGGTAVVGNNASVTINYTAKGSTKNPSTNAYDSKKCTFTISRTATIASGVHYYASKITPTQNVTGGFKFNFGSTAVTPTTQAFADNTIVTLTTTTAGYIYIFTTGAKAFVMSTDLEAAGGKVTGGVEDLGTVNTYSISQTYKVYRSVDSYPANKTVYVKAIV